MGLYRRARRLGRAAARREGRHLGGRHPGARHILVAGHRAGRRDDGARLAARRPADAGGAGRCAGSQGSAARRVRSLADPPGRRAERAGHGLLLRRTTRGNPEGRVQIAPAAASRTGGWRGPGRCGSGTCSAGRWRGARGAGGAVQPRRRSLGAVQSRGRNVRTSWRS